MECYTGNRNSVLHGSQNTYWNLWTGCKITEHLPDLGCYGGSADFNVCAFIKFKAFLGLNDQQYLGIMP